MKKFRWSVMVLGVSICLGACQTTPTLPMPLQAERLVEGTLDCFPAGLRDPISQALVTCEASAVLALDEHVLIASDKPVPNGSPFFSLRWTELPTPSSPPYPWLLPAFLSMGKTEAMTLSADGHHALASTAFDRLDRKSSKWDHFDQVLIWPVDAPEQVTRLSSSTRDGVSSSLPLRQLLEQHLGQPYFKVEGLMALPNQQLVFGIRELGSDYKNFRYTTRLVAVSYEQTTPGTWVVKPDMHTLLDFNPHQNDTQAGGLGLSSLEYDPVHDRIYILTSHEEHDQMGAYLWSMSRTTLEQHGTPQLVRDSQGKPLHFDHKAEGLTVLKNGDLFIVHDDDRQMGGQYQRQPHQAVYSVLRVLK